MADEKKTPENEDSTRTPEVPAEETSPGLPAEAPEEAQNAELSEALEKLAEARKSAEQFRDQLLRKAAEFENYRRRSDAEFLSLIKNANETLLLGLLPVLDDLARSLKAGKEQKDYDAFYRGVELIQSKLLRALESSGLKAFNSVGQPFNVDYHDALLQIVRADVPPHTVIEEVEQGYLLNDRVLRHAKVIVSAKPDGNEGAGPSEAEEQDADG
jgi:molecular chaperone GrpE